MAETRGNIIFVLDCIIKDEINAFASRVGNLTTGYSEWHPAPNVWMFKRDDERIAKCIEAAYRQRIDVSPEFRGSLKLEVR